MYVPGLAITSMGVLAPAMRRRPVVFLCVLVSVFFLGLHIFPKPNLILMKDDGWGGYGKASNKDHRPIRPFPPPTWAKLKQWEFNLPQHNLSLPFPEGEDGRYVRFSNQIAMLGWNNVLNELLMNTHLAYASQRAFVFPPYVWKPDYYYWPESQFTAQTPRTPLNAIIAGPSAGGLWDPTDNAPRSVSDEFFDIVCPKGERRIINTHDYKPQVHFEDGIVIFNHWAKVLRDIPDRCVEVVPAPIEEDNFPQIFDMWLFGCSRVLSLWETFSKSPTSRLFGTSPIVRAAVDTNEYLFTPRGPKPTIPAPRDPYERMMAMHVRRGDFKEACLRLAEWNSTFYNWNLLPFLPDGFNIPSSVVWNTTQHTRAYLERCLPDMQGIARKARKARDDYVRASKGPRRVLDIMYLLTNEKGKWVEEMKNVLALDGWNTIVTSADLEFTIEQREIDMAIDMEIARKAAVFVGNGWSSFTSNIVHRRLVDGKEHISIRFW